MDDFDELTDGAFRDEYYDQRAKVQGKISRFVFEVKPLALSKALPATLNQPLKAGSKISEVAYKAVRGFNGTYVKVGTAAQPTKFGQISGALGSSGSMRTTAGLDAFLQDADDDIVITTDDATFNGKLMLDLYRERTCFE